MSELWSVRRDYSHVTRYDDACLLGQALADDPRLVVAALHAGAVEQDVPGVGRVLFGIEWDADALAQRSAAVGGGAAIDEAIAAAGRDGAQAARRRETFDRFVADYIDPAGEGAGTEGAVIGSAFAAIVPAMVPGEHSPEFALSVELMAREKFSEPAHLLWEPIDEILNWIRNGYLWRVGNQPAVAAAMPAQRPREAAEPLQRVGRQ